MSTSAISKRYAKALVAIATEQKKVDKYGTELAEISAVFAGEDVLRLLMESPTFPPEKKAAILTDIMKKMKMSTGMKSFLGLLLEKGRLDYLGQIEVAYRELADTLSGVLRANIVSVAELGDDQQQIIKQALESQTKKQVELQQSVDSELLGGIKVEIGGRLFDGSLKTQLKLIEDTLKKG
ncbi:MAG: ATP synthase F1 subunit delta [Desulfuromonas sp.]|nr:MAG: ATP synthase F1 subunit delta [Desulfuromonas sp.]